MSRSSDGYYSSGQRRRTSDGYGSGSSYRQYGDSYGPRRSSRDPYMRDSLRSSRGGGTQGRGLMVNPWEGGVVPGSGGGRHPQSTPDIVASINQLSRMDNPESELALNILNAVLSTKEESDWGGSQRNWGRGQPQKRRMNWDDEYGYGPGGSHTGDGILPTPQVPPRKFPRRDPTYGPAYSWGVVGSFSARPTRGRGGAAAGNKNKKTLTVKKDKPKTSSTAAKTDAAAADKQAKPKAASEGDSKTNKAEKETAASEGAAADGKTEPEDDKAESTAAGEKATAEGTAKAKTLATKKVITKKEEYPSVPLTYLRCHICHMHKFNSGSNFMDHVKSKKHRRMTIYYQEKIESVLKLLRAQSWLKSQRHIVKVMKQKGKITRCEVCECPIKGGRGPHLHIREHSLLYHFSKCFTCKKRFGSRAELEAHKLTYAHMKSLHSHDSVSKERFRRWAKRIEKETIIPEQKLTEEFHESVTQMQMNNLNRSVWNKDTIPIYDPVQPTGLNHLVKQSLYVCSVCPRKVSQTAHEALEHTKTKEHYDCYVEHLKALELEKEKEEASEKEKKEAGVKKDDTKEQAKTKTKENKKTKKKSEDDDDTGMKDMENMEVIDEIDQEGNDEEAEQDGNDEEAEQEGNDEEAELEGNDEEAEQEGNDEEAELEGNDEEAEQEGNEEETEQEGNEEETEQEGNEDNNQEGNVEKMEEGGEEEAGDEDEPVDLLQEVGEDVEEDEPPPTEDKKEEKTEEEEKGKTQVENTGDKTTKLSSVPATPEAKSSDQDPPAQAASPKHMPKPASRAPAKAPVSSPQTRRGRGRGVAGAGARRST